MGGCGRVKPPGNGAHFALQAAELVEDARDIAAGGQVPRVQRAPIARSARACATFASGWARDRANVERLALHGSVDPRCHHGLGGLERLSQGSLVCHERTLYRCPPTLEPADPRTAGPRTGETSNFAAGVTPAA